MARRVSTPLGDKLSNLTAEDIKNLALLGVGGTALLGERPAISRSERVRGPFPTKVLGPFPTRVIPEESQLIGRSIAPGETSERIQGPFPTRVKGPFPTRAVGPFARYFREGDEQFQPTSLPPSLESQPSQAQAGAPAPQQERFYEWFDEQGLYGPKGQRHATNRPETIPQGVDVTQIPFEAPSIESDQAKLFLRESGDISPETIAMMGRASETDEARENRIVREIVAETGKSPAEARQAFRSARSEISGEPLAPPIMSFEEKTATRNQIAQNAQRMLNSTQDVNERNQIISEFNQTLKMHGLDKIEKPKAEKVGTPSALAKLINERAALKAAGVPDDDSRIKAYDSKISGTDIDIEGLTQDEIDVFGVLLATTGKMANVGRGKLASKVRIAIAKSAAGHALRDDPDAPSEIPGKTPMEAAFEGMIGPQADTRSIQIAQNFLEKQIGAMGSFVTNIEFQVDKVKELSKDLKTFDVRILNLPLRAVRGRIKGSPLQAKYDLYLTEIENEIGKLASGSSASIAELSVGAQERWAKIHDKNLSVKDMISLLEETSNAARMRELSVQQQLDKTRTKMRTRGGLTAPTTGSKFKIISVE